jgi:hypothetical protein
MMMEHKGHRSKSEPHGDTRYDYYLEMVKILEKLKREGDLKIAPKLLDRILDGQKNGHLTADQVFELSERIDKWTMRLQLKFASQEYQMNQLLRALENDQRKREKGK